MIIALILLIPVIDAAAETNSGSCKEMLQGYLTGQLASALGAYQLEALRREFKSVTDQIEKSLKEIKEKTEIDAQKMQGKICVLVFIYFFFLFCRFFFYIFLVLL